jgi:Glycosyl transferase family 2/Glycosyltransferase like family 2
MSNYAAAPQLVENVPYHSLDEMHRFARTWRDEHRGRWFTVPKLSGFCLLMTRAVYDKIGGLDERFGLGVFDDDDLAERARRAGIELAVVHDLFVHHFGSRTFAGSGIDAEKLFDENAGRFVAKWGKRALSGRRVALEPWSSGPELLPEFLADSQRAFARHVDDGTSARRAPGRTGSVPGPKRVAPESNGHSSAAPAIRALKTSLTVIARNEEDKLPRCLESVAGVFEEIIVVDTGSTDRTAEIARSFGARVFDFPWVDDFGAARNEALAHASGVVECPGDREAMAHLQGSRLVSRSG